MKRIGVLLFICFLPAAAVLAQPPGRTIFNAGILNSRVETMPKPEYPEAARQAKIGGLVSVHVVVDESGLVTSASADPNDQHTGQNAKPEADRRLDPTLMAAAELAARQATFKPFQVKGVPTKFSGQLIYNFVADNSNLPPRIGEIYGPLINSRALKLPEPDWPAEANFPTKTEVTVYVTIDETGKIIAATATAGPSVLRPAAEAAALKAEFAPWKVLGEPVQIRGIISYTFAPKKP